MAFVYLCNVTILSILQRTAEDSCQGGRRRREHNIRDAIIVEGITSLIDSRKWYEHSVLDCLRHILIPSINSLRTWLQLMMRWWKDTHIAARPVHIDSYSVHMWLKCVYPCDCIGACVSHLQSFLDDMKLHYLLLLPYSDSFSQGAHNSKKQSRSYIFRSLFPALFILIHTVVLWEWTMTSDGDD